MISLQQEFHLDAHEHHLKYLWAYLCDATQDQWVECSDFSGLQVVAEGL